MKSSQNRCACSPSSKRASPSSAPKPSRFNSCTTRVVRRYVQRAPSLVLFLLLTRLFPSQLALHLIGRGTGAGSPVAKSWLVRALVPGHLHVQGPRLLAMARHLARSLRTRHFDSRMDDLRRSARRNPRTPSTSCLGRTTSIIVSLYLFLS